MELWGGERTPDRHLSPFREGEHRYETSFRGRGPKNYRRADERIREDVCIRLTEHPDIDASDIEVIVSDGTVRLTGNVDDRETKRLAERVAETVPGVEDVQNELHCVMATK